MSVIIFAGTIGVGKSTYTEMVSRKLETEAFYESVDDNEILELFYADPVRWGFSLQVHFLNTRFKSIKAALHNRHNVLDRSIYEDKLFTEINHIQGNITKEEMSIYTSLLDNMMEELEDMPKKAPDLLIYLTGSFETILGRVKSRGRGFEQIEDDPNLLEYYALLYNSYDKWYDEYTESAKMTLNVDEYDIVNNPEDQEKVMKLIKEKVEDKPEEKIG